MTDVTDPLFRRLSPADVPWLDDAPAARAPHPGPAGWARPPSVRPPAPALWPRDETAGLRIGVRVRTPLDRPSLAAARLLAATAERNVHAVILSHVPDTGLERYGFRVESVAAATPDAARRLEDEIAAFWGIGLIVDADDLSRLG